MKTNEITLDNVDFIWFWENDHRPNNTVYVGKGGDTFRFNREALQKIMLKIKTKGTRFYTCDDDYIDGDDYRYGYFYPPKEINFDPVDQMEGDGHVHMFYYDDKGVKQRL